MANFKIKTPHAAVIVWNYVDRISADGVKKIAEIEPKIISTVSCISIQTIKSKGSPVGSFEIVLAPTINWVSKITAGSWCCILMSNRKITEEDLKSAKPDTLKMIGKIESVRLETQQNEDTRLSRYVITGVDWGYIFNNSIYTDNTIGDKEKKDQTNSFYLLFRNLMFGSGKTPEPLKVDDLMQGIINVMGGANEQESLEGNAELYKKGNRLDISKYAFYIPTEMANFLNLGSQKNKGVSTSVGKIIELITGKLIDNNIYNNISGAYGFLNPFSYQGTASFWQILLDNSNPAINEMFCDMDWTDNNLSLKLYNRIKPFCYKKIQKSSRYASDFKKIKMHKIDPIYVTSVVVATNWRDKYNFVEIRCNFSDTKTFDHYILTKTQRSDPEAFNREGFRPLIVVTKQMPYNGDEPPTGVPITPDDSILGEWADLLKEWFFDSHRLLNGTITITGSTEYIGVGNNILLDAKIINPSLNFTLASNVDKEKKAYLLAHVENVSNSFTVGQDGAREYKTVIQFVRGIFVTEQIELIDQGSLDQFVDGENGLNDEQDKNTVGIIESQN